MMSENPQPQSTRREPPSRRDFLKTSTVAVVGGGLATGLTVSRSAHAAGDDTIKIGLIGCGGRGGGAVRDAYDSGHKVKLVAMGDVFEDAVEAKFGDFTREGLGDRIDVPKDRRFAGFDAYKNVLNAGVDLVILATPPGFRPIHFTAAVEAGKHVFMEKPVAVDAPGVRMVLAAAKTAKEKNLGVGVGLQRRHQASYLEAIKRLHDGAIGDIICTRVYWNDQGVWDPRRTREQCRSDMEYQIRNWYYYNWLCGDHICEQHIHNLDVSNWIKNAHPITAEGMGGRQVRVDPKYGEIFDHHAVEFEYPDGSRAFSYCRHIHGCWSNVSEHAHGSKGIVYLDGGHNARIEVKGGEKWSYRGEKKNPYVVEHVDLLNSIRSGNPINEAEYGALSSMTSVFGRMATYSGKMLTWDEAINSQISLAPKQYAWDAEPPVPIVAVPGHTQVV